MKMLLFISLILIISFQGCSSTSVYRELFDNFTNLLSTPDDIKEEIIDKIPYDTMQVSIGRSENTLIVLEEVIGESLKWTSSNLVKIYTKNGFIYRLTGLGNELENIELDKNHPFAENSFQHIDLLTTTSFYTFDNPKLFRLPIKSSIYFLRDEIIEILGRKLKTKVYKESVEQNLINWSFDNLYWIDERGKLIKSVQHVTPKHPPVKTLHHIKQKA